MKRNNVMKIAGAAAAVIGAASFFYNRYRQRCAMRENSGMNIHHDDTTPIRNVMNRAKAAHG